MQIHRNLSLISLLVLIASCNGIATKAETHEIPTEKKETSKLNTDLNSNNTAKDGPCKLRIFGNKHKNSQLTGARKFFL